VIVVYGVIYKHYKTIHENTALPWQILAFYVWSIHIIVGKLCTSIIVIK